jgi:phenylpropionate dioxygenase-like ring-hydroxylating dioxygenase large terminal subunit
MRRGGWVDAKRGLVEREAFLSDEVYRLEVERIFDRTWMYLAHESEIPKPGDYVTRVLGSAPVVVVRDGDGTVRAHLNSCRHRGTKLCRAELGNVARFVCPYHGWAYERDGRLITTSFDRHFPDGADFSELRLISVPRLETYQGLIFGSWDWDVIDLPSFLGDFRIYLDAFFGRTPQGMQVLAPAHRWRVKANWKVGALNFIGDSQHVITTHIGPLTLDPMRAANKGLAKVADESFQVFTDAGHGCTLSYLASDIPDSAYQPHAPELEKLYEETLGPDRSALLRRLRVVVGTIFPNLSFIEAQAGPGEKAVILRIWHPIGGAEMEVLSWVLAEREASAAYKERVLKLGFRNFGAAGVFEQDDMELWASGAAASDNPIAKQYPWGFQTALRYLEKPERSNKWPGRLYRPADIEAAQFEFMCHWDKMMASHG